MYVIMKNYVLIPVIEASFLACFLGDCAMYGGLSPLLRRLPHIPQDIIVAPLKNWIYMTSSFCYNQTGMKGICGHSSTCNQLNTFN